MELRRYLEKTPTSAAGFRELIAVRPGDSINRVIERMQAESVGCVLVVENDRLVGIFTERDVIKRVISAKHPLDQPIKSVMTAGPETVTLDDPAHVPLSRMYRGGFRHLAVVDGEGRPIGTVSVRRVADLIADQFSQAVYNLPPRPKQYGTSREGA